MATMASMASHRVGNDHPGLSVWLEVASAARCQCEAVFNRNRGLDRIGQLPALASPQPRCGVRCLDGNRQRDEYVEQVQGWCSGVLVEAGGT